MEARQDDDVESQACMEQCKLKGRRKAICETCCLDRAALVSQLERYVRMHRLHEYGIVGKVEIHEARTLGNTNGPVVKPRVHTSRL